MADLETYPIALERDLFLRRLLRELAGTLQEVIGTDEAAGYISVVGAAMGEHLDAEYKQALRLQRLDREQVARVLVDLKRRIQGDFFIIEQDETRIVLGNRACPFGEFVRDRPSLCMMTSNVFGRIAAENLGYARVELQEAIARGHPGCRVVVHLVPSEQADPQGREYFEAGDADGGGDRAAVSRAAG
jgi:predicted ArsR family transcriptional regulator